MDSKTTRRRVRVRPTTYRGKDGYAVDGTETYPNGTRFPLCNIFVRRRETAEAVRDLYRERRDGEVGALILAEVAIK